MWKKRTKNFEDMTELEHEIDNLKFKKDVDSQMLKLWKRELAEYQSRCDGLKTHMERRYAKLLSSEDPAIVANAKNQVEIECEKYPDYVFAKKEVERLTPLCKSTQESLDFIEERLLNIKKQKKKK